MQPMFLVCLSVTTLRALLAGSKLQQLVTLAVNGA